MVSPAGRLGTFDPTVFETQYMGNDLVVYHRGTGAVHFLNPLAARLWRGRLEGLEERALVREVELSHPDVSPGVIARDCHEAIEELKRQELLPPLEPQSPELSS